MNRIHALILLATVSFTPAIAISSPIVTLYKDSVKLSAYTEVKDITDEVIKYYSSYNGAILPTNRTATVTSYVAESEDEPGGNITHYAFTRASTGLGEIALKSYSYFYWNGSGDPAPIWNGDWDTTKQSAVATLDWVFSVSEDIDSSYSIIGKYEDSIINILDTTTKTELLDVNAISPFYPVNGTVSFVAGHEYRLRMTTTDYSHDDDTESETIVDFGRDVKFVTVPEPSSIVLLGVGLAGLSFSRKLRTV
jgi:hypothetical protein